MDNKLKLLSVATLAALGLAACTTPTAQQVLTDIQAACAGLEVGESLVIQIASNIPGAAPFSQALGPVVTTMTASACSAIASGISSVVDDINNQGGTASVNVTTNSPAASAIIKSTAERYGVRVSHRKVGLSTQWHFVVPPTRL